MSRISITALTPVHIGSGNLLYKDNDFVKGRDKEGQPVIGILDARKILGIIGIDRVDIWVAAIESKQSITDLIKNRPIEDFTTRTMDDYCNLSTDTIQEQLHDGLGRPYIPGSSIKGALRTAVLSTVAKELDIDELNTGNREKISASNLEKSLFGKDPNSDIFRFLQVGDAIFGECNTCALTMANVNIRQRHSYWDTSKKQSIEAIAPEDSSSFEMRLKVAEHKRCSSASYAIPDLPSCMTSMSALFKACNAHTQSLLASEVGRWEMEADKDDSDKVSQYIDACKELIGYANDCTPGKSCIIRVGGGSGWRFITGAWPERCPNFKTSIVDAARPQNSSYRDYIFPKSRRVSEDCYLLGFVKLTLL